MNWFGITISQLADQIQGKTPTERSLEQIAKEGNPTLTTSYAIIEALKKLTSLDLKIDDMIIPINDDPGEYIKKRMDELYGTNKQETNQTYRMPHLDPDETIEEMINEVTIFAEAEDSEAAEAAMRFIKSLSNPQPSHKNDFHISANNFLVASAEQINMTEKDKITQFANLCRENKAEGIIERLVLNFTDFRFKISIEKLKDFAIAFSNAGFKREATILFDEATKRNEQQHQK